MPYHLIKQGDQTCVAGEDNKPVPGGCHGSRSEAVAHLRALYANAPDASKAVRRLVILDPATLIKGGPGSGYHGHAGRPGEVGGSAPDDTAAPAENNKPTVSEILAKDPSGRSLNFTSDQWRAIIREHGNADWVQKLLLARHRSAFELPPDTRDAVLPFLTSVDATTGLESAGIGDTAKMADWFNELADDVTAYDDDPFSLYVQYTDKTIGGLKKEVVDNLAEQSGDTDSLMANTFIRQWAESSNDTDMRSLGIQKIAADQYGRKLTDWQLKKIREAKAAGNGDLLFMGGGLTEKQATDKIRGYIFEVHGTTQQELDKRGIKSLVVYRGVKGTGDKLKTGETVNISTNILSSWSTSMTVARDFATDDKGNVVGNVVSALVPASWVYATPMTGPGCLNENEIILIGRPNLHVKVVM